ncbi:acyl-lipid (7-3)-desaturase (Delta-4 desaturase) [Pycnococcus provasolii]
MGKGGELHNASSPSTKPPSLPDSVSLALASSSRHLTAIHGVVYDITDFLDEHPGGRQILSLASGRDATFMFDSYHIRTDLVRKVLAKLPVVAGVAPADLEGHAEWDTATKSAVDLALVKPPSQSELYQKLQKRVRDEILKPRQEKNPKLASGRGGLAFDMACVFVAWAACTAAFVLHPTWYTGMAAGWAAAWVGTGIQHTANHGGVGKGFINALLGFGDDIACGGSSLVWRYHHMVSHHVYCNDDVHDMDVFSTTPIFRLDTQQPKLWYHRFQWLYMWAAYSTLWASIQYSDWEAFFKRAVPGVRMHGLTYREQAVFLLGKAVHLALNAALPIYLHGARAWLPAFAAYTLTGSLLLSWFFMVSHNLVPLKPQNFGGLSKRDWAAWQIATSATWGGSWASFFTGGLNMQIEHHLFPGLAHNLYPQVSRIVKEECANYKIKYYGYSNLFGITLDLVRCMSFLGTAPDAKPTSKVE